MTPPLQPITDGPPIPVNVGTNWPLTQVQVRDAAPKLATLLAPLVTAGRVTELRALHVPSGRSTNTVSGYFDDPVKLAAEALRLSATAKAVYFVPNEVNPALLHRRVNRCEVAGKDVPTTTDADIARRLVLPVDIDPTRPSGISATDAEKAAAWEVATAVRNYLADLGWPEPLIADSGNGFHLLSKIDQPGDDGGLVERCLKALAAKFDTPAAHVDTGVYNAARIIKLPGTPGRKGDDTADRPHRTGGLIAVPDPFRPVPTALLEALAGEAPSPTRGTRPTDADSRSGGDGEFRHRLDVPKYLAHLGIDVSSESDGPEGVRRWRITCPFNPEHRGTDAYVFQYPNGAVGSHCSHNSCGGNGWEQFKAAVGKPLPDHYDPPLAGGPKTTVGGSNPPPRAGRTASGAARPGPDTSASSSSSGPHAGGGKAGVSGGNQPKVATSKPVLLRLSDVKAEAIRWMWERRCPCGRLSLICGHPGASKSVFTMMMAATVSTGGRWPDGTQAPLGDVLLLSSEDGIADTVRPRLDVAGADCSRVRALTAAAIVDGEGKEKEVALTMANVDIIRDALTQMTGPKLVVVDPVGSYLGGGVDAHRDNEVRAVLAPMAALAQEFDVAIVLVAHTTKSRAARADDGVLGSRAFTGIVRAVHHIGTDPDDDTGKRLFFLPGKNNLGPRVSGLAYRVLSAPHEVGSQPVLSFEAEPVEMGVDEAFGGGSDGDKKRGPEPVKRNAAVAWLVELLRHGPRPAKDVEREAKEARHSAKTLRNAREFLGVESVRPDRTGAYSWRLPEEFDLSEYPAEDGGGCPGSDEEVALVRENQGNQMENECETPEKRPGCPSSGVLGQPGVDELGQPGPHWHAVLTTVLAEAGEGWVYTSDLFQRLDDRLPGKTPSRDKIQKQLDTLFEGGQVERAGRGHRGDPYRYRLPQFAKPNPLDFPFGHDAPPGHLIDPGQNPPD